MMTPQTISIASIHGGVALDADEAAALADLVELVFTQPMPDTARMMRGRAKLRRLITVLRGFAPERE